MCLSKQLNWFYRLTGIKPKPKIAKKDIVVYKLLAPVSNNNTNDLYVSPYKRYPYTFYKKYNTPMEISIDLLFNERKGKSEKTLRVDRGYHSIINLSGYDYWRVDRYFIEDIIFQAIIPKGSKYYKGIDGDIVSDQLIVTSNIVEPENLPK